MRKLKLALVVLVLLAVAGLASAQTPTVTPTPTTGPTPTSTATPNGVPVTVRVFTSVQDSYLRASLFVDDNTALCNQFSLTYPCTYQQLLGKGCVWNVASPINKTNVLASKIQYCAPFTNDDAGQALFTEHLVSKSILDRVKADRVKDVSIFCSIADPSIGWKALSNGEKNTVIAAFPTAKRPPTGTEACY